MNVPFFADGRTATISVRRIVSSTGYSLATNGKPDASLGPEWFRPPGKPGPFTHDASTQMLLPLVTLAHVPGARRAAVIGQGSGMSSHALLGNPGLERLVTIEIEPEMLRASRMFYPANRRVFDDPRSTFAIDDARSYFASRGERFDLILSEPSNPWVAGVSGLFTTEFYSRVKSRLAPGGVFAQWMHTYEITDELVLSILSAIDRNFQDWEIFAVSGRDIVIMASADRLTPTDWSVMNYPGVAEDLRVTWPVTAAPLRKRIEEQILQTCLADDVKAWRLQPDGSYRRRKPGAAPLRSQQRFIEIARAEAVRVAPYDEAVARPAASRKRAKKKR
jgi:hypothetical protein